MAKSNGYGMRMRQQFIIRGYQNTVTLKDKKPFLALYLDGVEVDETKGSGTCQFKVWADVDQENFIKSKIGRPVFIEFEFWGGPKFAGKLLKVL